MEKYTILKETIDLKGSDYSTTDIFDLCLPNNQRLQILQNMDQTNQYENLRRFMDIYRLSNARKIEKFFYLILTFNSTIDLYLKEQILSLVAENSKKKAATIKAFENTLYLMVKQAFQSHEKWLMFEDTLILYYNKYKVENIHLKLKNIIILGFIHLKCNEPFKKLFNLVLKFKNEHFFMDICSFIFDRYNKSLTVKNNLLLLQILFEEENKFMDYLFHILDSKDIEINYKLEACDILYLKGSENIKNRVQQNLQNILPDLAYTDNPENVHLSSVVASVDKTISQILNKNNGKQAPANLYDVLLKMFKNNDKIPSALHRIFNYTFLKFSKFNLTLKEIMENVYLFIVEQPEPIKTELFGRLEQELTDMVGTCSQGYITRLINVFSGFQIDETFNLGISLSYEDEIYGIFSGKINKLVSEAPDDTRDVLLEELMVPSNDYENRINLIRYLRPHLAKIWNEIFDIYKDELTTIDLDLYCRKVTMRYEGC